VALHLGDHEVTDVFALDAFGAGDVRQRLAVVTIEREGDADLFAIVAGQFEAVPHRWLDEVIADPSISITSLAAREHKSERSIRLILSLAFLAPDLAKAAMAGNLPCGFKRARLVDLPMLWSDQWQAIGLQRPSFEA
jgi:hypothetical protein